MNGKWVVLVAICLASTLGLISLVVPEHPTTITFTTTSPVTITNSVSATVTEPLITTMTPVSVLNCILFQGYGVAYGLIAGCSQIVDTTLPSFTSTITTVQTWTSSSWFTGILNGGLWTSYSTQTVGTGLYVSTNYGQSETIWYVTTEVTVSPVLSTSVTMSTITSSLTQTGYMTKQIPLVSTGSTYQEGAIALVILLAVSLLMAVLSLRKGKTSTGQSKLDSWQASSNFSSIRRKCKISLLTAP